MFSALFIIALLIPTERAQAARSAQDIVALVRANSGGQKLIVVEYNGVNLGGKFVGYDRDNYFDVVQIANLVCNLQKPWSATNTDDQTSPKIYCIAK